MAMLTLPAAVVQATVPWTFWSLPSMVTFAVDVPLEPAAAAVLWFDELLVDDLLLEHPDRPTTTIAVAAAATVTERFTRYSFVVVVGPSALTDRFGVCGFAGTGDSEIVKN
jgi:hypothetical protein